MEKLIKPQSRNSLKVVLLANAASCLLFGALFLGIPTRISNFIGSIPSVVVAIIGIGLLANGFTLIYASVKKTVQNRLLPFLSWVMLDGF